MDYTWDQYLAFSKAVADVEKRRSVELFRLLCVVRNADKDQVRSWIDDYVEE